MKKRTKQDFIKEQIAKKQDDLWLLELIRDINLARDPKTVNASGKTAAVEADAAKHRLAEVETEMTWLKGQLKLSA